MRQGEYMLQLQSLPLELENAPQTVILIYQEFRLYPHYAGQLY